MKPILIILSGTPASGKTTIRKILESEFGFPAMSKDVIKEELFDLLGWTDREWSKQLGTFSIKLLFAWIERNLSKGVSCIVDCNFKKEWDLETFLKFESEYSAQLINVHCTAKKEELIKRFERRANGDLRHPGHCDSLNLDEFRELLSQPWQPVLECKDDVLILDTTTNSDISVTTLISRLNNRIRTRRLCGIATHSASSNPTT